MKIARLKDCLLEANTISPALGLMSLSGDLAQVCRFHYREKDRCQLPWSSSRAKDSRNLSLILSKSGEKPGLRISQIIPYWRKKKKTHTHTEWKAKSNKIKEKKKKKGRERGERKQNAETRRQSQYDGNSSRLRFGVQRRGKGNDWKKRKTKKRKKKIWERQQREKKEKKERRAGGKRSRAVRYISAFGVWYQSVRDSRRWKRISRCSNLDPSRGENHQRKNSWKQRRDLCTVVPAGLAGDPSPQIILRGFKRCVRVRATPLSVSEIREIHHFVSRERESQPARSDRHTRSFWIWISSVEISSVWNFCWFSIVSCLFLTCPSSSPFDHDKT